MVVVTAPDLCQYLLSAAADLPKDPGPYHSFNTLTSPGGRTPNMLGALSTQGYWHLVRSCLPAAGTSGLWGSAKHTQHSTSCRKRSWARLAGKLLLCACHHSTISTP
jgi:hypothetical protein